jgi:bacterioferritin-associated ferredoxin
VQCGCCLDYAQDVIDEELSAKPKLRLVSSKAA